MIASKSQQSIAPKRSGEKGEACNDVQSVHLEFQTVNKFISPVATRREKRIRSKGIFIIIFLFFFFFFSLPGTLCWCCVRLQILMPSFHVWTDRTRRIKSCARKWVSMCVPIARCMIISTIAARNTEHRAREGNQAKGNPRSSLLLLTYTLPQAQICIVLFKAVSKERKQLALVDFNSLAYLYLSKRIESSWTSHSASSSFFCYVFDDPDTHTHGRHRYSLQLYKPCCNITKVEHLDAGGVHDRKNKKEKNRRGNWWQRNQKRPIKVYVRIRSTCTQCVQ